MRHLVIVEDPHLERAYVGCVDSDEWGARMTVTRAAHTVDDNGNSDVIRGSNPAMQNATIFSWIYRAIPLGAIDISAPIFAANEYANALAEELGIDPHD